MLAAKRYCLDCRNAETTSDGQNGATDGDEDRGLPKKTKKKGKIGKARLFG